MSYVSRYVAHRLRVGEIGESSATQIAYVLRRWERFAGTDPTTWTTEQVADWVHGPAAGRPNYRQSRLSKLRRYCRWLQDRGVLSANPTLDVARVRVPPGTPRDLTVDEVRRLIAVLPDDRALLIVLLMVQCGLRVGDLCRIQIDDIDRRRRRIHVRGKAGRGEVTHTVPIPDEAWVVLSSRLLDLPPSGGPLIRSDRYRRVARPLTSNHVGRMIRSWMRAAGIKGHERDGLSSHALRHSCAQHLIERGATVDQVRHVLGHKTEATTRVYLRRDPDGLREAMEGRRYLPAA